ILFSTGSGHVGMDYLGHVGQEWMRMKPSRLRSISSPPLCQENTTTMAEELRYDPVPDTHAPFVAAADRYASTGYRRVGNSGLILPPISLGLWWNFGDNRPFDTQREVLRHAFEHGITHFDLANNYGPPHGSAEENFGRMMRTDFK